MERFLVHVTDYRNQNPVVYFHRKAYIDCIGMDNLVAYELSGISGIF